MRVLSPLLADTPALATPCNTEGVETTCTKTVGNPRIPTVLLNTEVVSDNMAARLCISFLGHVLFLKNQVPFPIGQLAKIPTTDETTRGVKKRHELLNSFDTLASHLYTTFIALSTALALRGTPDKVEFGDALRDHQKHGTARAFLAVALGPTVGTAKSRVIVGIDGLETKVWGLRRDTVPGNTTQASNVSEKGESSDESDTEDEDEQSEIGESGDSNEEDENGSPPPSRSPSPTPSSDSDASQSKRAHSTSSLWDMEDPETVRAAERLLSRTLASACAEDDDHGLASEMAPTQTHVLLRAPRRFDHPCWVPRQNLCSSLDSCLADFLVASGERPISSHATKQRIKASKAQGVWIKSRESSTQVKCLEEDLAEEDELIWWSWDGKLVGFSDW